MRIHELIIYKNLEQEQILNDMTFLMENYDNEYYNQEDLKSLLFECTGSILELCVDHGFEGNLWHDYLTFLLANDENAYSTSCEIVGETGGSINKVALHDFEIFKELFDYDFSAMEAGLGVDCVSMILTYTGSGTHGSVFNGRIRDRICALARSLGQTEGAEEFKASVTQFYKEFGVGKLGLHKAFRVAHDEEGVHIVPITKIAHVQLDELVGYETAKKKLIDNTEAFVKGRRANNCLLFGDAGTGKSSSIKAILNKYYDQGLRMIEVYKHQFQDLNDVIAQIKNRNYKFIIYMDDLSFEEFEIEYKYLKAVIEGGLEKKPDNVLIYATSNRRHLIRETFRDKEERDEELHTNDTVQEKLSLVARFGVTIYFGKPAKKEFQEIVRQLAKRNGIEMDEEQLLLEANRWELNHGGMSGRTAQQFIDYLLGME
ncbi:ATP-binding protein [Faecalicatena contorta]|uniref:ATP-binding protein n=1 Tax=Faecalicatena fissicatena TaxID=290055 RepID=A0ABS2E5C5_9FIRM|nr:MULTISPECIES: ATP-binding protein [Faecalicatena]MBM6684336.1 ATP-binding protein [Faecalicatena contorta]MBM6709352.1 ATP-binding protein [Faecalicatena contorta]MBM6736841.1 ATP-binding protein [Faecalicatena fissicatena]